MPDARIRVSVVYATPAGQWLRELELPAGATVRQAIEQSRIVELAGLDGAETPDVGIFGRRVTHDTLVRDGDRIEIYRPLRIDPKEARRRRAALGEE